MPRHDVLRPAVTGFLEHRPFYWRILCSRTVSSSLNSLFKKPLLLLLLLVIACLPCGGIKRKAAAEAQSFDSPKARGKTNHAAAVYCKEAFFPQREQKQAILQQQSDSSMMLGDETERNLLTGINGCCDYSTTTAPL